MPPDSIIILLQTIIPVVAGVYVLYYSQLQIKKRNRISDNGIKADGVVFDLIGDSRVEYTGNSGYPDNPPYPIIRFVTSSGEWVTEKYSIATSIYKKGQKVVVNYDPDNPKEFILQDFGLTYFFYYLSFFISLCAVGYGFYNTYVYVFS